MFEVLAVALALVAGGQQNAGEVALSGDGAVWTAGSEARTSLLRGAPGRPVERIATVARSTDDGYYASGTTAGGLTASATHAAFSVAGFDTAASKYGYGDPIGTAGVLVDLASHRVTTVSSCDAGGAAAALAGTLLATSGCEPDAIGARDVGQAPVVLAAGTGAVRVAGRKVAWYDGTTFVVRDLDAGGEVLRVAAAALPGILVDWRLQADGKLAFALAPRDPPGAAADMVAWTGPGVAEPAVLRVGGPIASLRFAGDRIAFVRGDATSSPRPPLNEAVVTDLAGTEHVVARFPRGRALDFDGERIAFVAGTCTRDQVWIAPAAGAATAELTVEHCPAQVIPGDTRVDSRGRFRVRLFCPLPEPARDDDSCRIAIAVKAGRATLARGAARVQAGEDRTVRLPASPRLLRTRPRRVLIELRSTLRGAVDRTRVRDEPAYPRRR